MIKKIKKYYTKYLPVNGEIKPPCVVLEKQINGQKELYTIDTPNDIDLPNQELVKLFLCSRDIKLGDKLYWKYFTYYDLDNLVELVSIDDNNLQTIKGKYVREDGDQTWDELIKVIGEISPDATWIKEGDEFDENDWKPSWQNAPSIFDSKILIKDSLGFFH